MHKQINQGEIYWLDLEGISHPHVVIQDDLFNHSRISTTIVCAITTNRNKASMPGNVLLDVGEGNLEKESIIDVAKVSSVEKSLLENSTGSLSTLRVQEVLSGIRFLQASFLNR